MILLEPYEATLVGSRLDTGRHAFMSNRTLESLVDIVATGATTRVKRECLAMLSTLPICDDLFIIFVILAFQGTNGQTTGQKGDDPEDNDPKKKVTFKGHVSEGGRNHLLNFRLFSIALIQLQFG